MLIVSAVLITYLISEIDENSGNAGAFGAGLSIGVGIFGVVLSMFLGFISGSIAYVYPDKLPPKPIYKIRWSFMLCIPFILWMFFPTFEMAAKYFIAKPAKIASKLAEIVN